MFCNFSANCAMVMFWQVSTREPGGAPAGALAVLHHVRLAGSAGFIFGFTDTSEYAVTGRSSVWYVILKRSTSNARSIGASASVSIEAADDASDDAFATMSNRSVSAHPGTPTI